jgi:hypothetical protein
LDTIAGKWLRFEERARKIRENAGKRQKAEMRFSRFLALLPNIFPKINNLALKAILDP